MDPEFTESNSHDGVANLISVLRICEQIETNKETIEKNSDQGKCNDDYLIDDAKKRDTNTHKI